MVSVNGKDSETEVQRFSIQDGEPIYDMQGDWVRITDHRRALRIERQLAKGARRLPPHPPESIPDTVEAPKQALKQAVDDLKWFDWTDADIAFAAGLDPDEIAQARS